jgi:outer membrane receptor protein involved in Fe transport
MRENVRAAALLSLGFMTLDGIGPARADGFILEEVTVTATRRDMSVQDVPLSITALSGSLLRDMAADDLEDFAPSVAGLEFAAFAPGLNRITMRGISTQTGEASTGFYVDEMPITADPVAQPDVKTFDVDRVEILRGPQGTLFGEASMGGTIRIIMNQPDPSAFEAAVQGTVSDTKHGGTNFGLDGMVNVPLVGDRLALRVVGSLRENEGFIDNVITGENNINDEALRNIRAALAWLPNEDLRITANFHYIENDTDGNFISNRDWEQSRFVAEPRDDTSKRYNLTLEYSFAWADLVSSSSYFTRDTDRPDDVTEPLSMLVPIPGLTGFQTIDIDYDIFVQEVRLVSTQAHRLEWLIGAFYKDSERTFMGNVITSPDLGPLLIGDNEFEFEHWAVFGELTYHVTDRLHAVAGLRYFEEDNVFSVSTTGAFAGPGFAGTSEASADELTPRFSLTYDINGDAMIYATASKGFRTGGANATKPVFDLFGIPLPQTFEPDTLWNYELGAKLVAHEGRLVANGAFYYIDWKDVQLPASAAGVFTGTFNAGSATSKGVELEITAIPVDNFKFTFAGNYTDAELDEDVSLSTPFGPVPVAVEGNELPLVPEWKVNLGAEYRHPLVGSWTGVLRANASFSPERFNFADNNPAEELRSYELLDLQLAFESSRYDLVLFADNVTDEVVEYAFLGGLPAERFFAVGKPRTIGLIARARF